MPIISMLLPETTVELVQAQQAQERLIPKLLPTISGLDYAVECQRTGELGGDFFDFVSTGDSSLFLSIGDVAHEGAASAMVMAAIQVSVREHAGQEGARVGQTVKDVNRTVSQLSSGHLFASLFHACINTEHGVMEYVNSGYNFVVLLRDRLRSAVVLERTGTVLGLSARSTFNWKATQVICGDLLIAFTDGIADAMDHAGEAWDERVLLDVVRQSSGLSSSELALQILQRVDRLSWGLPFSSDRSALVVRFLTRGTAVEKGTDETKVKTRAA